VRADNLPNDERGLAVAVIEAQTTATGLAAADTVLKTADCPLFRANTVCPGKFFLLFGGSLSAVKEAYDRVQRTYQGELLDSFFLGHISDQLLAGLGGEGKPVSAAGQAVGVIETFTGASAIAAADAAGKAAQVEIVNFRLAQGMTGKGVVYLSGAVAAVEAALQAGAEAIRDSGNLCATGLLPSPHELLWRSLG